MTESNKIGKAEVNASVHMRGPVTATMGNLSGKPYAVINIAEPGPNSIHLFPDAVALDTLISEATRVRDEIRERERRAVKRVTRLGDDSETPVTGLVIGPDPDDDDYVFVRWEGEGPGADTLAREPFDDLSPVA